MFKTITLIMITLTFTPSLKDSKFEMDTVTINGKTEIDAKLVCSKLGKQWLDVKDETSKKSYSFLCADSYEAGTIRYRYETLKDNGETK